MIRRLFVVLVGAGLALGACTSGGRPAAAPTTGAPAPAATSGAPSPSAVSRTPATIGPLPYRPVIDPAKFTDRITNRYLPLKPGTAFGYDGTKDGERVHDDVVVTRDSRTVMGVRCVVVQDTVTVNGVLEEKTTDWYAQDDTGNVWYFGEATAEYSNGKVKSTAGSWEAGVNGAQPGIVMLADPRVGEAYRQEYYAGQAEDVAKVLRVDATVTIAASSYTDVVVTQDTNPFTPGEIEQKFYAPDVGFVYSVLTAGGKEEVKLTKVTTG